MARDPENERVNAGRTYVAYKFYEGDPVLDELRKLEKGKWGPALADMARAWLAVKDSVALAYAKATAFDLLNAALEGDPPRETLEAAIQAAGAAASDKYKTCSAKVAGYGKERGLFADPAAFKAALTGGVGK